MRSWSPNLGIFDFKNSFSKITPLFWIFWAAVILIILGAIIEVIRLLMYIGIVVVGIYILFGVPFFKEAIEALTSKS